MALHLGDLEELVLLAVQGRGEVSASVILVSLQQAGRELTTGALYPALVRLQTKGALVGRRSSAQPVRGGRSKLLYRLTDEGQKALESCEAIRHQLRVQESKESQQEPEVLRDAQDKGAL